MRAVIQRVSHAEVKVGEDVVGEIGVGILILLGIALADTKESAEALLDKVVKLRIFDDCDGKMNLSLKDVNGELLVVSQFTLYADTSRGRRPSFIEAAKPDIAQNLYEYFVDKAKECGISVKTGRFRAMMDVTLTNDGPVTFVLET